MVVGAESPAISSCRMTSENSGADLELGGLTRGRGPNRLSEGTRSFKGLKELIECRT